MIYKIKKRKTKGSTQRLLEYILSGDKTDKKNPKKETIYSYNIPDGMTVEQMAEWMNDTASKAPRTKNPIEHGILSFRPDENPDEQTIKMVIDEFLEEMGYTEKGCEVVASVHYDKHREHGLHVHLAINKVYTDHHDKGRSYNPRFKIDIAHKACRKIEISKKLQHDNGNYIIAYNDKGEKVIIRNTDIVIGENKSNDSKEIHQGTESFKSYLSQQLRKPISDFMKRKCQSWQQLHEKLAEYNLKFDRVKGGLRLVNHNDDPSNQHSANASDLSQSFSLSKLEKKLGRFEASNINYSLNRPRNKYNPEALATRFSEDSNDNMYLIRRKDPKLLTTREAQKLARQNAKEELLKDYELNKFKYNKIYQNSISEQSKLIREENKRVEREFNEYRRDRLKEKIENAKSKGLSKSEINFLKTMHANESAQLKQQLNEQKKTRNIAMKRKRKKLATLTHKESFLNYCYDISQNPSHKHYKAANSVLRGERYRSQRDLKNKMTNEYNTFVFVPVPILEFKSRFNVFEGLQHSFSEETGIEFKRNNITVFTDKGRSVDFTQNAESNDIEAGILLAAEKFGNKLTIEGNNEFKSKACKILAKHWHIQIKNPELQHVVQKLRDLQKQKSMKRGMVPKDEKTSRLYQFEYDR